MAKRKLKKQESRDLLILILLVPTLLLVTIGAYNLLVRISKTDARVCDYLGRVWLDGVPGDPSIRKGCFTYEELYSGD